jgi:sec-independent protein translocase protein TatA
MGISIPQLLIILLITALLFGTKKLRGIGSDLGAALKGFKKAVKDDDPESDLAEANKLQGKMADSEPGQESAQTRKTEEQV